MSHDLGRRVAIVIPARYQSSRFPGKPLAPIRGATGLEKPLIQRSYEAGRAIPGNPALYVATDDNRIAQAAERFGAHVLMTPTECGNGTERVAATLGQLPDEVEILINLQGDALLTPPDLVSALIDHMIAQPACQVATVAVRCSPTAYRHLIADQAAGRCGGTTAVLNARDEALYFSKRVLPYIAPGSVEEEDPPVLLHLGLYAYRREALHIYQGTALSPLEALEGLEQLRFLHAGLPVAVLKHDPPAWDPIELNNPTDLPLIETILCARGIA